MKGRIFAPDQGAGARCRVCCKMMRTFIYRCPATGYNVQGEYQTGGRPLPAFVPQTCLACQGMHLVDPATGRLTSEAVRRPKPTEK